MYIMVEETGKQLPRQAKLSKIVTEILQIKRDNFLKDFTDK